MNNKIANKMLRRDWELTTFVLQILVKGSDLYVDYETYPDVENGATYLALWRRLKLKDIQFRLIKRVKTEKEYLLSQ